MRTSRERAGAGDIHRQMGRTFILGSLCVLIGCANAGDDLSDTSPGPGSPYWASGSATNEGKSTHLWIVNHAVTLLGQHGESRAQRAHAWMTSSACAPRWRQALDDADHKVSYNNWYTWKSHFYDPSTGTNYLGGSDPVAYGEALEHLATARARLAVGDAYKGCYELGLSLHYATDMTQPMHAANFAATDWPLDLHSHLEDRAVDVQNSFVVNTWSGVPAGSASQVLWELAWSSNSKWPGMWDALAAAYASHCGDIDDQWFDSTGCWAGDAGVDAAIGAALRQAQTDTAAFLYAADLP